MLANRSRKRVRWRNTLVKRSRPAKAEPSARRAAAEPGAAPPRRPEKA